MGKIMRAIGLMSGTSMDGIDVALIDTDGGDVVERGPAQSFLYDPRFKDSLRGAVAAARGLSDRESRPGALADAERNLTAHHASAVNVFLKQHGLQGRRSTWSAFMATPFCMHRSGGSRCRSATAQRSPLRSASMSSTICAPPTAPPAGRARRWRRSITVRWPAKLPERPVVVLNIGGVANVTWIGRDGTLLAFDTGPGNAMIDDWMLRCRGVSRDEDGALAAAGRVHDDYVMQYLRHSYFGEPPPKSLDRNAFLLELVEGLSRQTAPRR